MNQRGGEEGEDEDHVVERKKYYTYIAEKEGGEWERGVEETERWNEK